MADIKLLKSFKTVLPDGVLLPGEEGYEDAIKRWSAACVKPAAAVFLPKTTDEVSEAVAFANKHSLPFTVCGGGHSTASASSIGPEGIVIDLRRMRAVTVDKAAGTVTYEGGCLWYDVDDAAWEHGLATPGGTVSHTGVGGLTLGGGFGWLSGRYGLVVDCLISVEMVLADGRVAVASETSEPDLFWAIRGAGTSFGVVTRFTSRAFPQGKVWGGTVFFPFERVAEVVAVVNEHLTATDGDQGVMIAPVYSPPMGPTNERLKLLMVVVFHNGTAAEAAKHFGPLLALSPVLDTTAEMPYPAINRIFDHVALHGQRWQHGAANVTPPLEADSVKSAFEMYYAYVDKELAESDGKQDLRNTLFAFELLPYGKIASVAPGATAHSNRGQYYNVGLVMNWTDPDKDLEVRRFKRELAAYVIEKMFDPERSKVAGTGMTSAAAGSANGGKEGSKYLYANYLDQEISAEGAFGSNATRLRRLKARYDPHNRFNKLWKLAAGGQTP